MRKFRGIASHISVIFSGVFLTLAILNQYNPGMGFLTSEVSFIFILIFCLTVISLAVATIADNRHHAKHMHMRAEEAERWKKISENSKRPLEREDACVEP